MSLLALLYKYNKPERYISKRYNNRDGYKSTSIARNFTRDIRLL
jgi:hypothetical protein